MTRLRIALAQINPKVGDLEGNVAKICAAYDEAELAGCDIVAFPELAITGYPPEDLVLKPGFVADNLAALDRVAAHTQRCAAVVGYVASDRDLYNAAAVCVGGEVVGTYRKRLLPNYAVFDEARYFTAGDASDPYELYEIGGVKVGISICEDVWSPTGPLAQQAAGGAELNININGSPFHAGKSQARERMLATRAADASCALAYVNQVCGQDELVFDGGSMVFDADGNLVARAALLVEELLITDLVIEPVYRKRLLDPRGRRTDEQMRVVLISEQPVAHTAPLPARIVELPEADAELYDALVLGTRDYVLKNGFTDVVVALVGAQLGRGRLGDDVLVDGGSPVAPVHVAAQVVHARLQHVLDHAVAAHRVAVDGEVADCDLALVAGGEHHPPELVAQRHQRGAADAALQVLLRQVGCPAGERLGGHLQVRGERGLDADGEEVDAQLLCQVGGIGLGVVAAVARRHRDTVHVVGTQGVDGHARDDGAVDATRQRDDQSLPPYEVLDPILALYVEDDRTAGEIIEMGHDEAIVRRITRLVDLNEYKRRQCPPGVRVSAKAFGKDRRLPITNGYRG